MDEISSLKYFLLLGRPFATIVSCFYYSYLDSEEGIIYTQFDRY